ncbi:unnamed protein product, partial [Iphiclides podalirius]
MIDESKDVTGFMALGDHPNVPSIDEADWENWMRNMFQEEDNDDIIALLDQKCPRLKEMYGEYYISEIIGRHPDMKRQIIVADHQDRAVGVMCLNAEINYEVLQNTYELHAFYGLRKATSLEKEKSKRSNVLLKTFGQPILFGKWGPFDCNTKVKQIIEKELLNNLDVKETMWTVENSVNKKEERIFVMVSGSSIVGLGVLDEAFSAWFISKKFTTLPKVNVDARIVVVGASRTTMAFLNALIFSVNFMSKYQMLNVPCSAVFYYGQHGVDEAAFVAINKSGIAYNKGILIDHQFRTKDDSIYAAGPATRYNSKYYADDKQQMYYDSYEIGTKRGFDTTVLRLDCENNDEKLPDLKMPEVMHCMLPGGLQYLEGHVIETFKEGYFKLHLTKDFIVDGITCLTPDKRPLENFANLYGRSAVVLNNVFLRYTAKKLDNLYEFFRSPWAYFLYHDKSDELFAMVKELLPKTCPRNAKVKMRSTFETSPYMEAITDYVIGWLSENEALLPVYLQPWHQSELSRDIGSNPAFKRRKRSIIRMLNAIY